MDRLTLILLVIVAATFVVAIVLDDMVMAVAGVGYAIVWAAFYLGEKLDDRLG